jgi:uncharacterized damage-inducible protein DinB
MTADQQAEFDRMRQYYQSQGERYSFEEIWPRVSKARLDLLDAFDGVTEEHSTWSPGGDEWSIKEVAVHLLNSSRNTRRLVRALSAGETGDSSGVETPRESTDTPLEALREQIRRDGIEWSAAILDLPPRPALEPTARHSMFGELHARAWYLFQRTHDQDHRGQIEAVKSAPGYPGAAPSSGGAS